MPNKQWLVQLVFKGRLGALDIDVACDDLADLTAMVDNSGAERSLVSIIVVRHTGQPSAVAIEDVGGDA